MLTLYEHPLSAFAMKAKIGLAEKGLEFNAIVPEGMMTGTTGGEFIAANPRAEIPTLIDGDVKIFDSTIILEYLEDKWPEPRMLPASPADRARVRMIEDMMDTLYEPNNWGLGEVLRFKRASGPLADKIVAFSRASVTKLQAWLEKQLGDQPWFNGANFGWGDVCVAPYLFRSVASGHPPPAGSQLAAWVERASARPSVAKVVEQMKHVIATFPDVATMLANGQVNRQYRDHRLEWMIAAGGIEIVREGIEKRTIRFSRLPD
jgi:glutathione S-transferase